MMGSSLTCSVEEILWPLELKSKIIPDPLSCDSFQSALTLCWGRSARDSPRGTWAGPNSPWESRQTGDVWDRWSPASTCAKT